MAPNYYQCLELLSNSNNNCCPPIKNCSRSRSSSPFKKCGGTATPSPIIKLCYNNLLVKSSNIQRSNSGAPENEADPIVVRQTKSSLVVGGIMQKPETSSLAQFESKNIAAESPELRTEK
jgi:hypothetical protein